MKARYTQFAVAVPSLVLAASTSYGASLLNLTVDVGNSTAGFYESSPANLVNDPFLYNPDNPASPLPDQGNNNGGVANGWHGSLTEGTHRLSLTLTGGSFTTTDASSIMYFDVYGRNANTNRDDNYTITLYSGNYTTQVAQLTGQGVADVAPYHNRSTFTLGNGLTFDRIQITSPAGGGDPAQYFTLMEVRAATVPEPAAALLSGLGALALLRRRRLS